MAHEEAAPKAYGDGQVFAGWESNDEVGTWPTPNKITKVEDGGAPGVLGPVEVLTDVKMLTRNNFVLTNSPDPVAGPGEWPD